MSNFTDFIGGGGDSVEELFDLLNTAGVTGSQIDTFSNTPQGQAAWAQTGFLPDSVVNTQTLMEGIAASSVVMNIVISSSGMMGSVVASSTAMTAVAASSIAMTAVAASSIAMNLVIASSTAMNLVIASSTAMTALYTASTKWVDDTLGWKGGSSNAQGVKFTGIGLLVRVTTLTSLWSSGNDGSGANTMGVWLDGTLSAFGTVVHAYPTTPNEVWTNPAPVKFNSTLGTNFYHGHELAYIPL